MRSVCPTRRRCRATSRAAWRTTCTRTAARSSAGTRFSPAGCPPDAVVMSWRGVQGAIAAAAAGHDVVLSPDPTLYFDHRQGSSPAEPPGRGALLTLEDVYRFDPLPGALAAGLAPRAGHPGQSVDRARAHRGARGLHDLPARRRGRRGRLVARRRSWTTRTSCVRMRPQLQRYRALAIPHAEDVFAPARVVGANERHMSQDLATCSNKLVLSVEDDAPLAGPRAVFLIDIMDPCWIMAGVAARRRGAPDRRGRADSLQLPARRGRGDDPAADPRPPPAGELRGAHRRLRPVRPRWCCRWPRARPRRGDRAAGGRIARAAGHSRRCACASPRPSSIPCGRSTGCRCSP